MSGLRTDDPDHVGWDELAVGWSLRSLEPDDEDRFAAHLLDCGRCQQTAGDGAEALARLVTQMPLQSPSPQLRDRLLTQAAQTPQNPGAPMPAYSSESSGDAPVHDLAAARVTARHRRGARTGFQRVTSLIAAAAAVLAIAGLGIWNVTIANDRDAAVAAAQQRGDILSALGESGAGQLTALHNGDGQTVATLVVSDNQAMVLAADLQVNDRERETYVIWGVGGAGAVPLGTFDIVHDGLDMRTLSLTADDFGDFQLYGLTLEQGRTAPAVPNPTMIASGSVS